MISAIFKHFQAILSKSSLTAGIFLRALSNPFCKSKIPLGYPKILMIVGLIIIKIFLTVFMSLWADMKIKAKNANNGVTSTVNLALHKDFILKTSNRKVRLEWWKWKKLHMERHYEGSHILFLESRAQSMSLQICISNFTIFSGSNIFGKILNIYEKNHIRYLNS